MAAPVVGSSVVTSATPGTPVVAIAPNQAGGYVVNPFDPIDQGLVTSEPLYVDQVGNAVTTANGTTIALQPGQSYSVIPNTTTPVTVSSKSASHKFTAVMWPTP